MGDSWLHEAVFIERPEMRVTVVYTKLCVERDMICGCQLVTGSCM